MGKKIKTSKDDVLAAAKKILDNPDMVDIKQEEITECYHEHFSKITKMSPWYQCDNCGNVMALFDVICYKDRFTLLKDIVDITEKSKEIGRNRKVK